MARATIQLIDALHATIERLRSDAHYEWGHMGACNCGHLVQTVTRLPQRTIHELALEREGDWAQQANDYCPTSGYRIDDIIDALLDIGMTHDDIRHLERLSDPVVLRRVGRPLSRNVREDAIDYMAAWAACLVETLGAESAELRAAS